MEPRDEIVPAEENVERATTVYSAAGVDVGLIQWFLSLTPEERLETLQNFVDFVVEVRNARESRSIR